MTAPQTIRLERLLGTLVVEARGYAVGRIEDASLYYDVVAEKDSIKSEAASESSRTSERVLAM